MLYMGGFPSGQRGQTVNLLATPSVVRIHLCPFLFRNKILKKSIYIMYRALYINNLITRGGAVWKLAGLITRRSQVQILSPLLFTYDNVYAQIAQLVEQRTENPRVTGSIPVLGIFFFCSKFVYLKSLIYY